VTWDTGYQGDAMEEKQKTFRKFIDAAAIIAVAYPFLLLLWGQYENVPGPAIIDLKFILEAAGMFLIFPAGFWLTWRYKSAPHGSHPIVDKIVNSQRYMALVVIGGPVLLFLLTRLIHHVER
jgi:hypothetical protein